MRLITDNIPARLKQHGVKICYLHCAHPGSIAAQFILNNYVPFDRQALDIGILGKELGKPDAGGTYTFDIAIPQAYAVMAETGPVSGELDGKPYTGPVWLAEGTHTFHRTGGAGRMGILFADAAAQGYPFLFDDYEKIYADVAVLPADRQKRGPELQ
jgi:hypothetical protein